MGTKYKITKRLERINTELVNIIIALIGAGAIVGALLINHYAPQSEWKNIVISIGCSLLAASLVSWLSSRYIIRTSRVKTIVDKWGLEAIYKTRQKMNAKCDIALTEMKKELDIIAWGLKSFRDSQSGLIQQKVEKGLKIRILTLDPYSDYVSQREIDEKEVPGQIKQTILHLEEWVAELQKRAPAPENIQIRFYNRLPEDFYFRVDDALFIGPYLHGISSQQTISYEFRGMSEGCQYYNDYFNKLWADPEFCRAEKDSERPYGTLEG